MISISILLIFVGIPVVITLSMWIAVKVVPFVFKLFGVDE